MNMKDHILAALREQFEQWEALLATMSAEQRAIPQHPSKGPPKISSPLCMLGSRYRLYAWKQPHPKEHLDDLHAWLQHGDTNNAV
jgi:hypothetical protein